MTRLANAAGHNSIAEAVLHLVVDHGDLRYSWSYLIDGHTLSLIMAIYGTHGHTLLMAIRCQQFVEAPPGVGL